MTRRTLVTAGPSLPAAEVARRLPGAEAVPPIAFGDVGRWRLCRGDRLVVLDGYFRQAAPVRHRELLTALADGVEVYGAASMGALRAAELDRLGMVGHGSVYRGLRDGSLDGDDEVALVHGSAADGWPVVVDAMVNLRATLHAAAAARALTGEEARRAERLAKSRGFGQRGLRAVLAAAGVEAGRFAAVRACGVDVKRADAAALLDLLAGGAGPADVAAAAGVPYRPPPARPDDLWTRRWARELPAADGTPSAADLLTAAALLAPGFPQWRHQHCLRVLAALELAAAGWQPPPLAELERAWHHAHPGSDLADRVAAHPTGPQAWAAWLRREAAVATVAGAPEAGARPSLDRLTDLAVAHLRRHGVLGSPDAPGLPAAAERAWLSAAERAADPRNRCALVATRTLGAPVTSAAADVLLVDLYAEGLVDRLADAVSTAARALPAGHPGVAALTGNHRRALAADWAAAWGVEDPVVECRRRGLPELPTLALALRLAGDTAAREPST